MERHAEINGSNLMCQKSIYFLLNYKLNRDDDNEMICQLITN